MKSRGWLLRLTLLTCVLACSDERAARLPERADSGFRLGEHAFAFENFASGYDGSTMNADLAARMFGRDNVCQAGPTYCQPTPDAEAWIESANAAMDAGRCEGFAVLSQLFFLGLREPQDFGAPSVRALKLDENYALQKEIAYWFATQLVPSAVENTALMPREALAFMADFMKEGSGEFYRIGMVERTPTGFGDAHSLTPLGFQQGEAANIYYVRVYDNNFPDVERSIRLDVDANTWEYQGVNSAGTMNFSGGEAAQNPLYFAPTAARDATLECPFCRNMARRTLVAHGVSPLVKDAAGNMVGIQGGQIIEGEGGSVTPGFSMCVNGVAPVVVSSNTPADMPIEVTLDPSGASYQNVTIQGGSLGSVTVGGDLSSKEAAQLQVTSDSVTIQPGGSSTTVRFMDGATLVVVTVEGDAGDVKVSRDPMTGKLSVDTKNAEGAKVEVTLVKTGGRTGDPPKVSYSFTATAGESSLDVDVPQGGWDGMKAPSASITTDGTQMPLEADHCTNKIKDGDETGTDCGGSKCGKCGTSSGCKVNGDCETGICGGTTSKKPGQCVEYWEDGVLSGDETDVDCGGTLWWQPCKPGKKCKVAEDCERTTPRAEGSYDADVYSKTPFYYCSPARVCTASPFVGGKLSGDADYPELAVRLTPDGLAGDASIQRIEKLRNGFFTFKRTMVTDAFQVEVVQNPSADTACWVSQNASVQTEGKLYFAPEYESGGFVPSNGFLVSCEKIATLCSNGSKDLHEVGIDCGGAECNGIGKYCAFGAGCAADADCGNPQRNAVCASMTCSKTYDVRGSVYTTVPVTLQLTPGGNLEAASSSPRTLRARPADTSFTFEGTRVTGAYTVSVAGASQVSCTVTGGTGDATGVEESFVGGISVKCTSCGNGAKEGKETDVDCGGADCVAENKLCAADKACLAHDDCVSGNCDAATNTCSAASCTNSRKDGSETAVDCGGTACVSQGKTCALTQGCGVDDDCTSGICDATSDTCVSCSDGAKNGAETAADCGGTACVGEGKTCALTQGCGVNADCTSGSCDPVSKTCVSCSDGARNGTETGTDCGGTTCVAEGKTCGEGQSCGASSDCADGLVCAGNLCAAPASWSVAAASTFGASKVSEAAAMAADDIWAAGDDLLAHFDGVSWSSEQPIGAGNQILGMFARPDDFGGSEVWVSGVDNIMQHWNGSSWFAVLVSFTGAAEIHAIHGTSSLLLAVGSEGQVARYDALSEQFNDEFGGGGGPFPGPGTPPPTSENLFAVFVLDDNHAWAAGANGTIIELDTGFWSAQTTPTTATLRSLWAAAADDVWAVGDGGVIIHYDGASWQTVASDTSNDLAWVWGDGTGNVWTVGASGTIRYTYGEGFETEDAGTSSDLGVVFGFDSTRWAMGAGTVLVERD